MAALTVPLSTVTVPEPFEPLLAEVSPAFSSTFAEEPELFDAEPPLSVALPLASAVTPVPLAPLTVTLPLASAVTPVPSAPLTVTPPSVTVTVPCELLAVALGEAASLALTVTLPLPALTAASAVEDALAVAVAVGAGAEAEVFCAPQALRPSAAIAASDSAAAPVRKRRLVVCAEV